MEEILNKFDNLKTWQKILAISLCIILLPLICIVGLLYLGDRGSKDISKSLMKKKQKNLEDQIEKAEKKDKMLKTEEEAIKIEKTTLLKEVENNEKNHAEYAERINGASSISELHAIARSIRGRNT